MLKEKTIRIILALGLGGSVGAVLSLFSFGLLHFFLGGKDVLQQDWLSYHFSNPALQPGSFLTVAAFIFLGVSFFIIYYLQEDIRFKEKENQGLKDESLARTEYTSFIIHELRLPLSTLRFSFAMLLNNEFGSLSKQQADIIQSDSKAVFSLISMVDNLLDVARIEISQISSKKSFITIGELRKTIEDFIQVHVSLAKEAGISLDYQFLANNSKDSLYIDWDQIKQVLDNLLENALNYSLSGGKVGLKVSLQNQEILFSVTDTGIGIPQEEQKKIFNKFYRASNARQKISKGTGIGLYLSKFFVDTHKGRIGFDSKEGQGTTFYFSLPLTGKTEEFLREI
jgi:signal transduction histidine kinase